ncbi:hypothetical protein BDV30DRAFT_219179 [Aspergillus minisclerotigenes]|uniref:Uncharacterized protein n=1 Tax=Aspergillus minisclerotigenes TaxID=656917 RepID=A0A5N6IMN5_9EURO|nr:hypothetical protein BDV30DRAFT_219179 [Aspergillus minisclerotigenes]
MHLCITRHEPDNIPRYRTRYILITLEARYGSIPNTTTGPNNRYCPSIDLIV